MLIPSKPKITWNNTFSVKPKRKNSQIKYEILSAGTVPSSTSLVPCGNIHRMHSPRQNCTPDHSRLHHQSCSLRCRCCVPLYPFYLGALDWRVKSAGSTGEHVSWVAGRAHSCISLVLVVVKTSHFTATRWAQKITAV